MKRRPVVGWFAPSGCEKRELAGRLRVREVAMQHDEMRKLEVECNRAAEEFIGINWGNSKTKVRAAVAEMMLGSNLFTSSMGFLLKECAKLPVQYQPARRLNDLVVALTELRAKKSQLEFAPAQEQQRGAA